jgi:hypothetical protein
MSRLGRLFARGAPWVCLLLFYGFCLAWALLILAAAYLGERRDVLRAQCTARGLGRPVCAALIERALLLDRGLPWAPADEGEAPLPTTWPR